MNDRPSHDFRYRTPPVFTAKILSAISSFVIAAPSSGWLSDLLLQGLQNLVRACDMRCCLVLGIFLALFFHGHSLPRLLDFYSAWKRQLS